MTNLHQIGKIKGCSWVAYLVKTYDIPPTLVVNMNEIDIHIFLKSYYAFVEKKNVIKCYWIVKFIWVGCTSLMKTT